MEKRLGIMRVTYVFGSEWHEMVVPRQEDTFPLHNLTFHSSF